MKLWILPLILLASVVGLAACGAESSTETPADPAGPALIMFYTDN